MSSREETKMMRAAAKEACAEKRAALANNQPFTTEQMRACCTDALARLKQEALENPPG